MEEIKYRVICPASGKFMHFTSLNKLIDCFTAKELMAMMKKEESSPTKTHVAVILNSEVIGYVSLNKIFNNLFKVEHFE